MAASNAPTCDPTTPTVVCSRDHRADVPIRLCRLGGTCMMGTQGMSWCVALESPLCASCGQEGSRVVGIPNWQVQVSEVLG